MYFTEAQEECDPLEYDFDLLEVGCTGIIEVIPPSINKTSKKELSPLTTVSLCCVCLALQCVVVFFFIKFNLLFHCNQFLFSNYFPINNNSLQCEVSL